MDTKSKVTIAFLDGSVQVIEEFGLVYIIDSTDAPGCVKVFYKKKTYIYPLHAVKEIITEL